MDAAGTGSLLAPQFVVGKKASNATLVAKFSGLNQINNMPIEFDINLTWTAIGSAKKTHAVAQTHDPDSQFGRFSITTISGLFTDARVAGSQKIGGTNIPTAGALAAGISETSFRVIIKQP